MKQVGTLDRVKQTAKKLRRALVERGVEATHTRCLDALAFGLGFRDYHDLQLSEGWDAARFNPHRCADRIAELHGVDDYYVAIAALVKVLD